MSSKVMKVHTIGVGRLQWYCSLIVLVAFASPSHGQVPSRVAEHSIPEPTSAAAELGPNSGVLRGFGRFQTETVLRDSGIQVFLTQTDGRVVLAVEARGVAILKIAGEPKRYRFDLLPNGKGALVANANLARVKGKQVELEVLLGSLPPSLTSSRNVKYRDVITVSPSAAQLAAAAVARQAVCPVSGKRLGSMGTPVAVTVGNATVYACCSSCVKSIQSNPKRFAAGKPSILVSTTTSADANAIARQKVCPVMEEPLGGMGKPLKVMIGDQPVYLCCKGCVKRIEAEPLKYLDMVYKKRR
ncbi:MAG: hypothetical protein AAFV88_07150 [Planctomycetota bacterium]